MLRLMLVLARVALCVPLLLLGACTANDDAVYPPEPATARQLPPVVASPGQVVPSATATPGCVGARVVKADQNPLLLCLRVGASVTVVLPEVPGEWQLAKTNNEGVASVKHQSKTKNGGAHFDVLAGGGGMATITVQNPGTGEAPGRVATVAVIVSG
jgi:hypothetical protein